MSSKSTLKCTLPNCSAAFNRQWKLDRHICIHTGERPFKCELVGCVKAYTCKQHLARHVSTAHGKKVILECTIPSCKSTFTSLISLKKHVQNHGKPRNFHCTTCGVSFQRSSRFKNHVIVHSGKLPYVCNICNIGWASKSLLCRHLLSHKTKRCSYEACSYTCESRSLLRKHEKIAHPSVYYCSSCNKSFNNKGTLRDHVMTHLPQELRGIFTCPHSPCQRAYFQLRNLRHHVKVFHNVERYYCTTHNCTSSFISKVKLEKHVMRRHAEKDTSKSKEVIIRSLVNIAPVIPDGMDALSSSNKGQYELCITSKDFL